MELIRLEDFGERVCLTELERITRYLEERNIPYWLDGGTLLGIMRDDWFIPWDYDIDLGAFVDDMFKDDFRNLPGLVSHNRDEDHCTQINRIIGDGKLWTQIFWKSPKDDWLAWEINNEIKVKKQVPLKFFKKLKKN